MGYDEIKEKLFREKMSVFNSTVTELTDEEKQNAVIPDGFTLFENREKNSRKEAYIKMLSFDYQTQEWIEKPEIDKVTKKKRNTRKNIDENYKAVTGNKSGLSRSTLLKRKSDFDKRRDISASASLKIAEYIKKEDWDADWNIDELIEELDSKSLDDFKFDGDSVFLDKFSEQMPILNKAEILFERLMSGTESEKLADNEKREEMLKKLACMKDVKQLYEDKMSIISSPYYVSIRAEDLKGNQKRLKKLEKDKKVGETMRRFAAAVLRIQARTGEDFKGAEEYSSARAAVLLDQSKEDYKDSLAKKSVTGSIADSMIRKVGSEKINDFYNDRDEIKNVFVKHWIYEDLEKAITQEQFLQAIDKMDEDIRELKATDPKQTETFRSKLGKQMTRIRDAVKRGEVSMDVARLWLDRALMQDKQLGRDGTIYHSLQSQPQINENKTGQNALDKKERLKRFSDSISDIILENIQEKEGYRITLQKPGTIFVTAKEQKALQEKLTAEWNERKKKWQKRKEKFEKDNPGMKYQEFNEKEPVVKVFSDLKKDASVRPDFIHIRGKNCEGETLTRTYISAVPEQKTQALKNFIKVLKDKEVQDDVYFKVSNTNLENRVDDIVVYFSRQLTADKIKEVMDAFYAECNIGENKEPVLMGGNYMAATTSRYVDGISFAPEPDTAYLLNIAFGKKTDNEYVNADKEEKYKNICDKLKPQFSYNTFIIDMFTMSMVVANRRLGRGADDYIDIEDQKTLTETKKVFREFCLLNGMDPETMVDEDVRSIILKKKR